MNDSKKEKKSSVLDVRDRKSKKVALSGFGSKAIKPKNIKLKIPKIKRERELLNTGAYENVLWVLLGFLIINTMTISLIAAVGAYLVGWSYVLVGIIGACGLLDIFVSIPLMSRLFKTLIKLIRLKANVDKNE